MVPDMQEPGTSPAIWQNFLVGLGGMLPVAALARVLYHYRLVRLGRRRFWSRELLWEAPTAIFSAILGSGIATAVIGFLPAAVQADQYRTFTITHTIVGFCAWLGPRGIEAALAQLVQRHVGTTEER